MAATMEAAQQQDCSALKDELAKVTDKMMSLKLSQLKKRAKKNGIPDEAIEAAAAGADDEEDTKCVLISLILKAACVKACPSPTRARAGAKALFHGQTCPVCEGCIRPPGHDGACMDGQCNDIEPEAPKQESALDVGAEVARHKVVKEEVVRKVEEKVAAEEEARRQAAEERAKQKAAEDAQKKEAERKAAVEAAVKAAERKAALEATQQKAYEEEAARLFAAEVEAKRQKAAEQEAAFQKAAEEEAARQKAAEEEAVRRKAAEEEVARQQAAEEEAAWQKMVEEETARQKAAEQEEATKQQAEAQEKAAEEEAREKEMEERRAKRRAEEEAEMAEMDERCVNTFLDCATLSWRERVRTPVKGTILYTKHIRPCRPAGTSVDVKDSSFRNLGGFLEFLEREGLLRLKPGLTDPVVTDIHFDVCRDYNYDPAARAASTKASAPTGGSLTSAPSMSLRPQFSPSKGAESPAASSVGNSWLGCSKRFQ